MQPSEHRQLPSCSAGLPYPDIYVKRPNAAYGRAMLDNIGGANSEMSAVSLYIYNALITGKRDSLPELFHKVSIVEMHHLEVFGTLARQLGENPRLWTQEGKRMVYWTPDYNQYPMNLQSLLLNVIRAEKNAVSKYQAQSEQIQDACIVKNLNRIILDEKIHIEIFEEVYHKYFT